MLRICAYRTHCLTWLCSLQGDLSELQRWLDCQKGPVLSEVICWLQIVSEVRVQYIACRLHVCEIWCCSPLARTFILFALLLVTLCPAMKFKNYVWTPCANRSTLTKTVSVYIFCWCFWLPFPEAFHKLSLTWHLLSSYRIWGGTALPPDQAYPWCLEDGYEWDPRILQQWWGWRQGKWGRRERTRARRGKKLFILNYRGGL